EALARPADVSWGAVGHCPGRVRLQSHHRLFLYWSTHLLAYHLHQVERPPDHLRHPASLETTAPEATLHGGRRGPRERLNNEMAGNGCGRHARNRDCASAASRR